MAEYKCFKCQQAINDKELKKRFVCPNCGSKVFFKPRTKVKTVSTD